MAILYRHIRLDNNKPFYIGIGKTNKRAYSRSKRNKYWISIVEKTEYKVEILFDDLTWEQACEKECEFIKLYGRKDKGTGILTNMTDGGDGAKNPSEYAKELSRKRLTGNTYRRGTKNNDLTIEKIKKARANQIITEEHKKKISEAGKGRVVSEETKKKIGIGNSKSLLGRKLPKEVCEKMSKSRTGEKHWNYKITPEMREYIIKHFIKRDKNFGATPLSKKFNISQASIANVLKSAQS
jgi:hypothetical protein